MFTGSLQARMQGSGEWHTGEVVSLCESYGFIRKDGERPDIFMHYDDVEGFEPQIGDRVSFELAADARFPDRQKAVAVEYSRRPRPARRRGSEPSPSSIAPIITASSKSSTRRPD